MPEFHVIACQPVMLEDSAASFRTQMEAMADGYLTSVHTKARAGGVICDTVKMTSDHPWKVIVQAAGERRCDLIFMASHVFASCVKSGGLLRNHSPSGPFPLPSTPWQLAQLSANSRLP